jgi:cytochrome c553
LRNISIVFLLFAAACHAQNGAFATGLYPVLEKAACRNCHNRDGVASATRLHFPEVDASSAQIEAFGKALVVLVDREHPDQSLLLRKPTNRIPHGGGKRIQPGSPEETKLLDWIATLTKLSGDDLTAALHYREQEDRGTGAVMNEPELRRLTHSQYNHTIRDLLGDQSGPANQFPPEDFINGFKNQSLAQNLSPILLDAYSDAAERLARAAFHGGDTHGLIPCKPSVPCRAQFVRDFGKKAFRRPLTVSEQKRYEALMGSEIDFVKGAQLVVEAVLQSPNFLFWMYSTEDPKLKPYATASRLSYTLWDTMPNAELIAAAEKGELATKDGVEKVARRMLDQPRAHEALDEFTSQWLRFDRLLTASKDRRKYPLYTRETALAMTDEARAFISDLVWNGRNFMTAFTADYGYVGPELAGIYGVPAPAKEIERIPFPKGSERSGLLGQGLFLALTAKPDETSPTARGLFVREQFLCQHVPDPPPGVNTNLPAVTAANPQTNRERMSAHATDAMCAGCHRLVDPIGFGFEKFDAVGVRRDNLVLEFREPKKTDSENEKEVVKTVSLALNTNGNIAGIADSQFASPADMGAILAKSPQCQECVVKQYFRYSAGRVEGPADRPLLRQALLRFQSSQFQFKEVILAITAMEGTSNVSSDHQTN